MRNKLKLGELLIKKELINEDQLADALREQKTWGKRLGMTLVRMGCLVEEDLVRVLANQLKLPVARIRGKQVDREVIELVSVDLAEKHRCLPLFLKQEDGSRTLYLAMEDPSDETAREELEARVGEQIRPILVAPSELEDALQRYYHRVAVAGGGSVPSLPLANPEPSPSAAPEPENPVVAQASHDSLPPLERVCQDFADAPDLEFDSEFDLADESGPEFDASFELDPDPEPAREREPTVSSELILRALSQLLVEKGVIDRDELVERLDALARDESDDLD